MILPPKCLFLASWWSIIPWLVDKTTNPNCLEGKIWLKVFSKFLTLMLNLGEMTPHLLILPFSSMTILPFLLSSMISNSLMYPKMSNLAFANRKEENAKGMTLTVLLHDLQEFDNDLGAWSNHDLSLSNSFSINNRFEYISQYVHEYHDELGL